MKYRYTAASGVLDTKGRFTKRPLVEVKLSRSGQVRKFLALIDSGADQVTLPAAIAEVFGIDRDDCPKRSMMGISMDVTDGFIAELEMRVQHQAEAITVPVVFIDTDVPLLLGQEGFFDHYRIKFEKDHDTFEITPAPKRRSA